MDHDRTAERSNVVESVGVLKFLLFGYGFCWWLFFSLILLFGFALFGRWLLCYMALFRWFKLWNNNKWFLWFNLAVWVERRDWEWPGELLPTQTGSVGLQVKFRWNCFLGLKGVSNKGCKGFEDTKWRLVKASWYRSDALLKQQGNGGNFGDHQVRRVRWRGERLECPLPWMSRRDDCLVSGAQAHIHFGYLNWQFGRIHGVLTYRNKLLDHLCIGLRGLEMCWARRIVLNTFSWIRGFALVFYIPKLFFVRVNCVIWNIRKQEESTGNSRVYLLLVIAGLNQVFQNREFRYTCVQFDSLEFLYSIFYENS